ncbi:HD family phosphohydrolase [Gottfriedia acidiceleris]|uniref:HD family phosphohydrolase n=1 Tax=Gottfriedia acidiceleris TaxID=371036 RepID=UPI000B449C15|nr:HD family phosphohydrolase [Gottfriedia acidiceleris]
MNSLQALTQRFKNQTLVILLCTIAFSLISFLLLISHVRPVKYDIQLLSIADDNIYSPITIEDKGATAKKRLEAAARVEDVYKYEESYTQKRIDIVNSIFDIVAEVKNENAKNDTLKGQALIDKETSDVKKKLPDDIRKNLEDSVFSTLVKSSEEQLNITKASLNTAINNVMSEEITTNQIEESRGKLRTELSYVSVNPSLKDAMISIGEFAIVPNYFFDAEETKERKRLESESVDSVYILQGQVLVKAGETITKEKYDQLKLVGLIKNKQSIQPYIGLILLIGVLAYFVLKQTATLKEKGNIYIVTYYSIVIFTILILKIVSLFQKVEFSGLVYVAPVAIGTLLIKFLLGNRYLMVSSIIFSICGSLMFNEDVNGAINYSTGIYILFSSIAVLFLNEVKNKRSMILHAGFLISLVNIATLFSLILIRNGQYSSVEIGIYLLMGLTSGVLSSVITMGILPFVEDSFGMVSSFKLVELGSPNHPLLRKILLEAPGTYHHSIMVANLAEGACEAIGANGLLARVGAYYHDIGKTKNPGFFIENQMGGHNPHDRIKPIQSKDIILKHVSDGVQILKKYNLPKDIIDIAAEHHGTTLLKYFYYKEKETNPDVIESDFRYPGPKAHSKESAIVGIADSVEAAVRSLKDPDMEKIEALVSSIMNDRLNDGQFAMCELNLKELYIVEKSLCETLKGTFHSRIQYPDER